MESTEAVVRDLLVERLRLTIAPGALTADTSLFAPDFAGGLGLDSLASLEVIAALSDRFDVSFEDVQAGDLHSISTLVAYLKARGVDT